MNSSDWERQLVAEALAGLDSDRASPPAGADGDRLRCAYVHCARLTARHSRTFWLACRLLPPRQRRAMHALYAFCRTSDDLVDVPGAEALARLEQWRAAALAADPDPSDPVVLAWSQARAEYAIPLVYAHRLLEGVGADLTRTRWTTFSDLADYCYSVACTVGLMSMHITGFTGPEAVPYAIRLGVALQLTNILRDVGEDWQRGRVYLPQEELTAAGLGEADLAAGRVTGRWRALMRAQIARNRQLYAQAWPGIARLHPEGQMAVAAAAGLYAEILGDIEAHDYDVFSRRAHVSGWGKLRRLPSLWQQLRQLRRRPLPPG